MKRLSLILPLSLAAAGVLGAAEPALLAEARRALAEGIAPVAIEKLAALRAQGELAAGDRQAATLVLCEALLAAGRAAEGLREIESIAGGDATARLLKAHLLAQVGRWGDALPIYEELARSGTPPPAAELGRVESCQALGRTAEAIEVLRGFVRKNPGNATAQLRLAGLLAESGQAGAASALLAGVRVEAPVDVLWKRYIEGRLFLLNKQPSEAAAALEQVTQSGENPSESLLVAATLALTDARIALSGYDVADGVLERFVWKYPSSAYLELVMRRLDQVYAAQKNPQEGELQKWAASAEKPRAALARYYLARMQVRARKWDRAMGSIAAFVGNFSDHPLLPKVYLMQADVHLERRQFAGAVQALEAAERHAGTDELRAGIELRTGLVQFQQGEYLLAANKFESAARRSPALRLSATFDAALATLNQKNFERFFEHYRELSAQFPESELRPELILEEGLLRARSSDPRAEETLQLFLSNFPSHPRVYEARLALGELAFLNGRQEAAARYLQTANEEPRSGQTDEHAGYLAVFLEESKNPRDDAQVIALARQFIKDHPDSPRLAEVRLKLGQVYFRNANFADAETQFATLASEAPEGPYAETALYLAGQSAMKTINEGAVGRALEIFDQVAKREGPLKLYARQQQALIQSQRGKEEDAIRLYDLILAAQPAPDAELRYAALAEKGGNLLVLGRKDPSQLEAAIGVFAELAALPGVPPAWRNQALYKKASALERLERIPEAQVAYYDVLGRSGPEDREYLWFYKAGFDAARLFEARQDWKSAIGVYEKMAAVDGPRLAEVKTRARELRLNHFLWE